MVPRYIPADGITDWRPRSLVRYDPICHLANFDYPGVVTTEAIAGGVPGSFVGFQTLLAVGTSARGPSQVPTSVTSPRAFELQFKSRPGEYLGMSVRQWFANSGLGQIFITRVVGAGATKATATLSKIVAGNPVTVLQFTSVGEGADYNGAAGPPAAGISIQYQQGLLQVLDGGVVVEQYNQVLNVNQSGQANADNIVASINSRSNLIQVQWIDKTKNPDDTVGPVMLAGGSDGAAVAAADIVGNPATLTGIYSFATKALPLGFVCAPGYPQQIVGNALTQVALQFHRVAMIDSTFGNGLAQWKTERNQYAEPTGRAVYVAGWLQVPDSQNSNVLTWCPRSAARAALISRSHAQPNSLANVGAGLSYTYANVVAMETDWVDDLTQGDLNSNGIDIARNFTSEGNGRVQWAARTLSTNPLYRFVNTPIILNVLEVSIEQVLKQYVFGVIDGQGRLASAVKDTLNQMLWTMWSNGVLYGPTFSQACKVVVDTSDPLQLQNGILPISVYVKTPPIAERIPVTVLLMQLGYNPETGEVQIGTIDTAPDHVLAA